MSTLPFHEAAPQAFPTYAPGGTYAVESVGITLDTNTAVMDTSRKATAAAMERILNTAAQAGGETTLVQVNLTKEMAGWAGLFFVTHFPPDRAASDAPQPTTAKSPIEYGEV